MASDDDKNFADGFAWIGRLIVRAAQAVVLVSFGLISMGVIIYVGVYILRDGQ